MLAANAGARVRLRLGAYCAHVDVFSRPARRGPCAHADLTDNSIDGIERHVRGACSGSRGRERAVSNCASTPEATRGATGAPRKGCGHAAERVRSRRGARAVQGTRCAAARRHCSRGRRVMGDGGCMPLRSGCTGGLYRAAPELLSWGPHLGGHEGRLDSQPAARAKRECTAHPSAAGGGAGEATWRPGGRQPRNRNDRRPCTA